MSDFRKLLDLLTETSAGATGSGSVAAVPQSFQETQRRQPEEEAAKPEVIEYGNWENTALSTSNKLKKSRKQAAKIVKSIYGAGDVETQEAANPAQQAAIAIAKKEKQKVAEGSDKLPGTPVVSLKYLDTKDYKKDKYGRTVPKNLKPDDPRVKFYKEKQGVAEGSDVEYIVVIRDEQGKRSIRVSALTPTDAKEKAEAQGYKVLKVKDPNEKHYFREQGVAEGSTGWHPSSTVKNPNFNDELSGRRVSPPGKRLKSGGLDYNERTSQERTKALMKRTQNKGGLTGPKGPLPEAIEALDEQDLVINPASVSKRTLDLVSKKQDRTDHEVAMARSDLYQAGKNAAQIFKMIADLSEERGLEGWVQEKIIKAADYLNTVREYLEGKKVESLDGISANTKTFLEDELEEGENKQVKGGDPCWKGYEMVGMKNKGGRKVPNCVPAKKK
jgi:hypothetical protein